MKEVTVEGPFEIMGDLCMEGKKDKGGIIDSDWVQIGGDVEIKGEGSSIGHPGNGVGHLAIGGECKWDKNKNKADLCDEENAMYGDDLSTTPTILDKPEIDWQYWFEHAMPGPQYGCTVGSLPTKAPLGDDDDLDGDSPKFNMTPKNSSYSCQVTDSAGYVLGELSWDHLTHVLKVKGVIYLDGDVTTTDNTITNYQGKATIYISGSWHNHEIFCAGGDGTNDCRDDMSNWDPTTNMLWIIAGATSRRRTATPISSSTRRPRRSRAGSTARTSATSPATPAGRSSATS